MLSQIYISVTLIALASLANTSPTVELSARLVPLRPGISGAAITNTKGDTKVYYQTDDNAIHELTGTGPPIASSYDDKVLILGGNGSTDPMPQTPLAVLDRSPRKNFQSVRIYYIGMDNMLKEYCWDGSGWYHGAIFDFLKFNNQGGSKLLYAICDSTGYPRVGISRAGGVLSEVFYDGSWHLTDY